MWWRDLVVDSEIGREVTVVTTWTASPSEESDIIRMCQDMLQQVSPDLEIVRVLRASF